MYLAHHQLESVLVIVIMTIIVNIVIFITVTIIVITRRLESKGMHCVRSTRLFDIK